MRAPRPPRPASPAVLQDSSCLHLLQSGGSNARARRAGAELPGRRSAGKRLPTWKRITDLAQRGSACSTVSASRSSVTLRSSYSWLVMSPAAYRRCRSCSGVGRLTSALRRGTGVRNEKKTNTMRIQNTHEKVHPHEPVLVHGFLLLTTVVTTDPQPRRLASQRSNTSSSGDPSTSRSSTTGMGREASSEGSERSGSRSSTARSFLQSQQSRVDGHDHRARGHQHRAQGGSEQHAPRVERSGRQRNGDDVVARGPEQGSESSSDTWRGKAARWPRHPADCSAPESRRRFPPPHRNRLQWRCPHQPAPAPGHRSRRRRSWPPTRPGIGPLSLWRLCPGAGLRRSIHPVRPGPRPIWPSPCCRR